MINTIDVDFSAKHFKDKHYTEMIIQKIQQKKCCKKVTVKPSFSKGEHITINCLKNDCYLCRFVFDDTERFRKDMERPPHARNVFFNYKYININTSLTVFKP